MRWLRFYPQRVQLVPQPSLSEVPGCGAREVAGSEEGRTVAGRILPRGLHPAGTDSGDRFLQQRNGLRYSVPRHIGNVTHHRPRSETSGRGDRFFRHSAYLGTEFAAPSAFALRRARWRPFARSGALDLVPAGIQRSGPGAVVSVSPPVSRTTGRRLL